MATHDIVVIGASAGGIEALSHIVERLPGNLPASIFVVVHFPTHTSSVLPPILTRRGDLTAFHPRNFQAIEPGRIYIAPPDFHLHLHPGYVRLVSSARENGFRPAIDPLFRTAASAYGPRVVGILLSGMLDDGVTGLDLIHRSGGVTMVQDPAEALFPNLPKNAIERVHVDEVLTVEQIAQRIVKLAQEPIDREEVQQMTGEQQSNRYIQEDIKDFEGGGVSNNHRTVLTCPECGGILWEIKEGGQIRYNCHVGHSYTSDAMLSAQADTLESALWIAVRVLEERAALIRRLAKRASSRNSHYSARHFIDQAEQAERDANLIRSLLERADQPDLAETESEAGDERDS